MSHPITLHETAGVCHFSRAIKSSDVMFPHLANRCAGVNRAVRAAKWEDAGARQGRAGSRHAAASLEVAGNDDLEGEQYMFVYPLLAGT